MERTQTDWTGQTLYAGIDLHHKKWVISVQTRDMLSRVGLKPANPTPGCPTSIIFSTQRQLQSL